MLMRMRQKLNSVHLLHFETKRAGDAVGWIFVIFRERRRSFSLDLRAFGPSVLVGARSKVGLRGEGYAWTPIWCSSNNSKR